MWRETEDKGSCKAWIDDIVDNCGINEGAKFTSWMKDCLGCAQETWAGF